MSLKKNVIIEDEFRHLFEFKDSLAEDEHNASILTMKFLSEVESVTNNRNISRKKLAELIGTSASYVTQLFRGDKLINMITLAKIERSLDIEFEVTIANKSNNNYVLKVNQFQKKDDSTFLKSDSLSHSGGFAISNFKDHKFIITEANSFIEFKAEEKV